MTTENGSFFNEDDFPFLKAFIEGTSAVLRTHAAEEPVLESTTRVKGPLGMGEVLAVMHVTGGARGFVALGMSRETAGRLVAALLGISPDSVASERMHDGAGELLNMITGNAKSMLADTPYHFALTTPSSVTGSECVFEHKTSVPRVALKFKVCGGALTVLAALHMEK